MDKTVRKPRIRGGNDLEEQNITLENPSDINQPPPDQQPVDAAPPEGASEWLELEKFSKSAENVRGMVVFSDGLRKILKTIERLSPFRQTVLIEGESGTGNRIDRARAPHLQNRAPRPFRHLQLFQPGRFAGRITNCSVT